MEEYRNKVVNYQPINPRISANLPVKLTRKPHRGGGHGGASPLYEPSRECISPPDRGGAMGPWANPQRWLPTHEDSCSALATQRDQSRAPLYLGSIGWSFAYRFLPILLDFLGRL